MAEIPYRITKKITSISGEKKIIYMPALSSTGKVETKSLGKKIAVESTISDNEAKRFLEGFVLLVKQSLLDGYQIKLDKLGTFSPSIKSKTVKHPDDVDADVIQKTEVIFKPSQTLTKELENAKFRKIYLTKLKYV